MPDRGGLILGDCRNVIATFDACSIPTAITDPPYGLGFMGKGWDHGVPGVEFWDLVFHVLKPGGTLLAFGGTRTFHRLAVAIEDAGFEIRDCLAWLYGSGFPKSHNLGDGWGTALKPAWEPILLAMKPRDGTFAKNLERHGVAGLNIDGARIGSEERFNPPTSKGATPALGSFENCDGQGSNVSGRWPANVLLDEEAARQLDRQAGLTSAGGRPVDHPEQKRPGGDGRTMNDGWTGTGRIDRVSLPPGGPSRFFYTAKASHDDRGNRPEVDLPLFGETSPALENRHPTVKPTTVMEWLVELTRTPTGGVVLDPFMGSGTTGVACKRLGRPFVGIEIDPDSFAIATQRIDAAEAPLT